MAQEQLGALLMSRNSNSGAKQQDAPQLDIPDWVYGMWAWVQGLQESLWTLNGKVDELMAVDIDQVARLVAVSTALASQVGPLIAENEQLKGQVSQDQANEAAEAAGDKAANDQIAAAADAVAALVNSSQLPNVAPVPIADVPGVASGDVPVTDPDGSSPVADPGSDTSTSGSDSPSARRARR